MKKYGMSSVINFDSNEAVTDTVFPMTWIGILVKFMFELFVGMEA